MIVNRENNLVFRFRDKELPIEIEFHDKMKLDIRVNHEARIRVKAPQGKEMSLIEERLRGKTSWILRQLLFYEDNQDLAEPTNIRAGSSFRFLGREYLVEICISHIDAVEIHGKFIWVGVKDISSSDLIGRTLTKWFRSQAIDVLDGIYNRCFEKIHKYGVEWTPYYLKKMKGRWGSCTAEGAIYLNPDLVMFPPHLIEYAVLHEMCHLISHKHDSKFYKYLDLMMPDWASREKEMKSV